MKLEILLSCMHQTDLSIVKESCITGNVLIINQANEDSYIEEKDSSQIIRMLTTQERGLSRSRNKAIANAEGDICLLCDDDERFHIDYEKVILKAFQDYPQADVIAFNVVNKETRLKPKMQKLGYLNCLKIASYQIAFRRNSIVNKQIEFDPFMGAGSGNGCGEENKFLWDCLRCGLRVYFSPEVIAELQEQASTWFFGYDKLFFYQRGAATRYMMGGCLSIFYGFYYLIRKRDLYAKTISTRDAVKELFRGILENPIRKQAKQYKKGSK